MVWETLQLIVRQLNCRKLNRSQGDAVDQFVRYIRLGCAQKGIELSEEDVDKIHMLVLSTLETFVGKKPKQIQIAVNKFNAMNHR